MGSEARHTLKKNITRLLDAWTPPGGRKSLRAWAMAHKIPVKVAQRAFAGESAVTMKTLGELAEQLDLEPWQLLYPDLDPSALPRPDKFSNHAFDVARMIDRIKDEDRKKMAHAAISQTLEFGNVEQASEAPSPEPTETPLRPPHR